MDMLNTNEPLTDAPMLDRMVVPPQNPLATANMLNLMDPLKIGEEERSMLADATGLQHQFIDKVLHVIDRSSDECVNFSFAVAKENLSSRVNLLCNAVNFSELPQLEPVDANVKLFEVANIVPLFSDEVIAEGNPEAIADIVSKATGVDKDQAKEVISVAQRFDQEQFLSDKSENEDFRPILNMTSDDSDVQDVYDSWHAVKTDIAESASYGATEAIQEIALGLCGDDVKIVPMSVDYEQMKTEDSLSLHVASSTSVSAIAQLAVSIADTIVMKAAAELEEDKSEKFDDESIENSIVAGTCLQNFSSIREEYFIKQSTEEIDQLKSDFAKYLCMLGNKFNLEDGFWAGLCDFISRHSHVYGEHLGNILVKVLPTKVQTRNKQFLFGVCADNRNDMLKVFQCNLTKSDAIDLVSKDVENNYMLCLGVAVYAWIKVCDGMITALDNTDKSLLAQLETTENNIVESIVKYGTSLQGCVSNHNFSESEDIMSYDDALTDELPDEDNLEGEAKYLRDDLVSADQSALIN
ncbi:MAG: hypothetical protein MJZ34_02805 [Paludibacteraceae bacterium]|nr:hypothetical protein [Paludibacteraceae bacterium]